MSSIWRSTLLVFFMFLRLTSSLELDCFLDSGKISCRCIGFDRDTRGFEDLGELIAAFIFENQFPGTYLRHVELRECGRMSLFVNLRSFVIDLRPQNISILSFENVDDLTLDIQDIDYGNKQFVFKSILFLRLTGRLEHTSTRVSFYIQNNFQDRGDVAFDNFRANSYIQLINIQDAQSVRVSNSYFYDLQDVDILRADNCYLDSYVVGCNENELFVTWWYYQTRWARHPIFISLVVLFILALLLGIFGYIYVKHWKKKKELELLGYPASTISRSTPVNAPQSAGSPPGSHHPPSTVTVTRLGGVRQFEQYK